MEEIIRLFSSENSPVIIASIFLVLFFIIKIIKFIFKNKQAIADHLNKIYYQRKHKEELLEKINSAFIESSHNTDDIKKMEANQEMYHQQSISIRKDINLSINNLTETVNTTQTAITDINKILTYIVDAQIEGLYDRITQKCKYYTKNEGIPEDEIEDFQRMFDVYKHIDGNHGLEKRFNKTMELPIVPQVTKED